MFLKFYKSKSLIAFSTFILIGILMTGLIIFSLPAILGGRFLYPVADYSASAKTLITKSFENFEPSCLIDTHIHVAGIGNSGSGIFVSPKGQSILHFGQWLKTKVYMSASAVEHMNRADEEYWERLNLLVEDFKSFLPSSISWKGVLLAFEKFYDTNGIAIEEKTSLHVPNQYVHQLAVSNKAFSPAVSIHPDKPEAINELRFWHEKGARIVKWLPNSMRIDPSSDNALKFLTTMKELDMVLLTHVGEERAVDGEEFQVLGNPLLYRKALDQGVKIIMAHVASLGDCIDLEMQNKNTSCFELFWRLFENPKYTDNLFGELSAVTLYTRLGAPILKILESPQTHHRLVNGSDYPLPGVNWIFRTTQMVKLGFITEEERVDLNQIYRRNPLLFDFIVKRTIRHPVTGAKLSNINFSWPKALGGCDFFKN
jgi:predicted TIM-barrel fold metal-dependent hydrolase